MSAEDVVTEALRGNAPLAGTVLHALGAAGYVIIEAAQLRAFARDCVTSGDMTPGAEWMLLSLLSLWAAVGGVVEPMTPEQLRAAFWEAMRACGEDASVDAFDYPYADEASRTVDGRIPSELWEHMSRILGEQP